MQLSFSALRARGAVALLRYLQWLDRWLPDGERPGQLAFAAAPETQGPLERLVDEDPSRAVRAALAAELPVLAALDRDWLAARITGFADAGGDTLAQVAWTTYLRYAALLLSNDPALAPPVVELLEALAQARTAQSQYLASELLADLLRPALDDGDLRDRAVALVHQFGEQGYLTLRALLD